MKHIIRQDRDTALQDALQVVSACKEYLAPQQAYEFRIDFLIQNNRVSVTLLSCITAFIPIDIF